MASSTGLLRLLSVCEVIVSVNLIIKVIKGTAEAGTFLVFATVTLLFCLTSARNTEAAREERSRKIKAKAKLKYDKERLWQMKEESLNEDGGQYETKPINPNIYANKILRGEITIEDIPSTQSQASQEYIDAAKDTAKNEEEKEN